jgi:hypothetical protein
MELAAINQSVLEAPREGAQRLYDLLANNYAKNSGPYLGIVRNALSADAVRTVLRKISATRSEIPERWAAMEDSLEVYWISDPGRKDSRIFKRSTAFSYSAWQSANRELIDIMEPMFKIQLAYLGMDVTGPLSYRKPSDGEYDRAVFHEYECPEGFLTSHKDFNQPCPLQMLTLFQKGPPDVTGGLVVETEQGKVCLDKFGSPGDTFVFPFETLHGVAMSARSDATNGVGKSTRIVGTLIRSNNTLDSRKVYTA